jgi:hypothetical protein
MSSAIRESRGKYDSDNTRRYRPCGSQSARALTAFSGPGSADLPTAAATAFRNSPGATPSASAITSSVDSRGSWRPCSILDIRDRETRHASASVSCEYPRCCRVSRTFTATAMRISRARFAAGISARSSFICLGLNPAVPRMVRVCHAPSTPAAYAGSPR